MSDKFDVSFIAMLSIISIEAFKVFAGIGGLVLQLIVGILTIVYLIKKIRKK